jgi:transposase, IS5 family
VSLQPIPWQRRPHRRRLFISGQKRGVFGAVRRELRRRSAIEPVIGHMKAESHLGRCYLKGRTGDASNAILSSLGHNFRRILAWLKIFLALIRATISLLMPIRLTLNPPS